MVFVTYLLTKLYSEKSTKDDAHGPGNCSNTTPQLSLFFLFRASSLTYFQIRKAIQEREAEAYRPVEELNALKSRITELESNITQRDSLKKELQAQYAQEKARRLKSENDLKSAVADLSRERVSSKKQVELIKVQQNQIEKARNLEATLVKEKAKNTANNSKLEKAKALYDTHKETINLVCGKGNDAIKKRKNVLSAFEREFGELVNGGKSIGG